MTFKLIFRSPSLDDLMLSLLFTAAPLSAYFKYIHPNSLGLFIASGLVIIPLAKIMGTATEEIAEHVGPTIGGLLNATFGNATELIIALFALNAGLIDVVKFSLAGSIISNLLLVLGFSIFLGGTRYETQNFQEHIAKANSSTMTLAVIAILMPTVFSYTSTSTSVSLEHLSLLISLFLIAIYALSVIFESKRTLPTEEEVQLFEEEELSPLGFSIFTLLLTTLMVAVASENLVGTIEVATSQLHLSAMFTGVILLPIIGNAAEHATAVTMAMKNKMDLSLSVAIGSSKQVALLLIPICVIAGYFMGQPMDLNFGLAETSSIVLAVVIANSVSSDGESNWLEGLLLITTYIIMSLFFFF